MTTQDTIDQAAQIIERYWQSNYAVAEALADAGLLAEPKCARECEALVEWDALVAERDEKIARLEAERDASLAKLDRVRVAADKLAECEAFDHDSHDTYHEGRRDAYDVAEQVVRDALGEEGASE